MRYFPRGGGKYNTYCYNDGLFYEEDPMMKRKQTVLMMAVMTALLTPSFGEEVFADDLSQLNKLPGGNFEVTGSNPGTYGKYDSKTGTFTWTEGKPDGPRG